LVTFSKGFQAVFINHFYDQSEILSLKSRHPAIKCPIAQRPFDVEKVFYVVQRLFCEVSGNRHERLDAVRF
jgi:hypothetical protein